MHLVHDFKVTYAKLGLFFIILFSVIPQICNAQEQSKPIRYKFTLKEALPLMEYKNTVWIRARLFRKSLTADEIDEIRDAGFKYVQGLASFTEISDFDIRNVVYDLDNKEFTYIGTIKSQTPFDSTSEAIQGTPVDGWWDEVNGKYSIHAETPYGVSANTLNFLKSIIQGERVKVKDCSLGFELLNQKTLSNHLPSPIPGPSGT